MKRLSMLIYDVYPCEGYLAADPPDNPEISAPDSIDLSEVGTERE